MGAFSLIVVINLLNRILVEPRAIACNLCPYFAASIDITN